MCAKFEGKNIKNPLVGGEYGDSSSIPKINDALGADEVVCVLIRTVSHRSRAPAVFLSLSRVLVFLFACYSIKCHLMYWHDGNCSTVLNGRALFFLLNYATCCTVLHRIRTEFYSMQYEIKTCCIPLFLMATCCFYALAYDIMF